MGNSSILTKNDFSVGEHNVILTITDDGGAFTSETIKVVVGREDNQKPIADAGEDKTIKVGIKITFRCFKSYDLMEFIGSDGIF